jgi:hypothetical protein
MTQEEVGVKSRDLLRKIQGKRPVVLETEELTALLESAEILREDDTSFAGPIRILRVDDRIVVQENTTSSTEVVCRELASLEEAEAFVEERLAAYERMWDGCGCKIDYFN